MRVTRPKVVRHDVEDIDVQDHVYLKVYWKVMEIGKGPAVILHVFDREIMKFDCYGEGRGHYHLSLRSFGARKQRLGMPEKTIEDQIKRAGFELTTNASYYIQRNPDERVRAIGIDPDRMKTACAEMAARMLEYARTVPELRE